ncbi:hypothetical protein GCM10023320_02430 [Pseudonocardia adelaidensis]|uniref:Uncharacterized protein n=1 Tax=Pseudonocardia adelaidensis TaxID=648754 RepID=A0ABP9N654_9PSEU
MRESVPRPVSRKVDNMSDYCDDEFEDVDWDENEESDGDEHDEEVDYDEDEDSEDHEYV